MTKSKAKHPEVKVPTNLVDIGYIAGLLDGEGCIYYINTTKTRSKQIGVKVSMTDREVIDYLLTFGGYAFTDQRKPPRKPIHNWYLTRGRCVFLFLQAVLPYMRLPSKRARIEEFLSLGLPSYGDYSLDQEQAEAIRSDFDSGLFTKAALGRKYGVGETQIRRVLDNVSWATGV